MTDTKTDDKADATAKAAEAEAEAKKKEAAAKAKAEREASIVRRNPEDPKSDPVLDFATYAEAETQAKALGKGASVVAIGTAYHVETNE